MRIVVTGKNGQVAKALAERGALAGEEIILLGRPELDLAAAPTIAPALVAARPDVIVSAAAYTAVDKAESEQNQAFAINAIAPGVIGAAAARLGVPVIHLSTDYVFAGDKPEPYLETDPTGPATIYGLSKLAGERALAEAAPNHAILRTAWIYSPFGANFLKTMLRIAKERDAIRVVCDQRGNPTSALDIADAILEVARRLAALPQDAALRGVFHLVGQGEASWAEFAAAILESSAELGGPVADVVPITTAEYPTPARRPGNSRLSGGKLSAEYDLTLPDWHLSMREVVRRLIDPVEAQ